MIWLKLPDGGMLELTEWALYGPDGELLPPDDGPDPWRFDPFS